jgi:hypothetical protein
MISLEDCIAFSGLDEDEVAAIGEHEHIPDIAATALANYLLKQPHGGDAIREMIVDDIHQALDAVMSDMQRNCSWHCATFLISTPKRVLDPMHRLIAGIPFDS